jgi:hypothetical protein
MIVPFICHNINYEDNIIDGKFIHNSSKLLEKELLNNSTKFTNTHIKGPNYILHIEPDNLKPYHIYTKGTLYSNSVIISRTFLQSNSILLFNTQKNLAQILLALEYTQVGQSMISGKYLR